VAARLAYRGRGFRFFGSGEYGGKSGREHYHLITFGLGMHDLDPIPGLPGKVRIPQWKYGFIDARPLNYNRARYTAKYIQKDDYVYGKEKIRKILDAGLPHPTFRRSSQGIGKRWAFDNIEQIKKGYVMMNGFKRSVPRQYLEWTGVQIDPDAFQERIEENERLFEENYQKALSSAHPADWESEMIYQDDYIHQVRKQKEANMEAKIRIKDLKNFSLYSQ
jgi:hypothetical protein